MKFLMCEPSEFSIEYSINPWMNLENPIDTRKAMTQWQILVSNIIFGGGKVKTIPQNKALPDMVFSANAGIVHNNKVVLSNFKHEQRQGEHQEYKAWFEKNNYEVLTLKNNLKFEGRGDCFVWNDYLVGAYGFRSDKKAIKEVAKLLNLKPIILELQDERFYHLDTCMSVLNKQGFGLYYPNAFLKKQINKLPFNLLPVSEKDACNFVCNNICITNKIIMSEPSQELAEKLLDNGYNIRIINTSEFIKSGGSARCLVLEI